MYAVFARLILTKTRYIETQNCYEQLYSSASDRENKQKTIYTKQQNNFDMQHYQAVTCV